MAEDTTILNTDVSVYYLSNNRTKMLDWVGTTGTYTMNELYSAMATLLDESDTIDDGSAFFADTPVEYTTGKIDAGDNDPWYVSFRLMEHITGGSLRTSGWTHVTDSNIGIVIVPGTNSGTPMVEADLGQTVTGGTDGSGTLLEIIEGSKGDFLVIRPDSSVAANEFLEGSQVITSARGAYTFTQSSEDQNTGEMIWANIYSIGTIDANVHMYVYQGARATTDLSTRVYAVNSMSVIDYWGNGHIDICVPIKAWDRLASVGVWNDIDGGYLRVFARKGGDLFASFEVANSTTSGGRNPVPMQTSLDLDAGFTADASRGHGTKKISFTGTVDSGPFINGEIITGAGGGRGIIDLTNSTVTASGELVYWPVATVANGGALTVMGSSELITGAGGANVTSNGAPADDGPADSTWYSQSVKPTIVFANAQVDVDNNAVDENYGITIDCQDNLLTEVYQWMKYICQYTQGDTDEIEAAEDLIFGEEYEGATAYFGYSSGGTGIAEGEAVTQQNTLATGVIISHDLATNDVVLLRSVRNGPTGLGFNDSDIIDADDDADTFTPDEAANFAATVAAPLGTFAGGTYFGARGVVLSNVNSADENKYILTDIEGNARKRPTSITITVTNVHGNAVTETDADLVAVYMLTASGGDIEKVTMTCDGGESVGDLTLDVDTIPTWVPAAGRVVLVDVDAFKEYVIGYASYASNQFVLSGAVIANLDTGTDENTLVSTTTELDALQRGDIIVNDTRGAVQYVTDVQAASKTVNCSPDIVGQVPGDTIYVNSCPDITVDAADKAYAAVIHKYPTGGSAAASIIYPGSEFFFRVKVRNSRETDLVNGPIKPYSSDGSTTGTNQSIPTVRTIDTIIS
jgi:hypothetical protein